MATATAKLKQPVIQPLESVTLTLNENEVKTLMIILNRIGGDTKNSPRKYAQSISDALYDALGDVDLELDTSDMKVDESISRPGAIYFDSN